jgi:hypothetical protein
VLNWPKCTPKSFRGPTKLIGLDLAIYCDHGRGTVDIDTTAQYPVTYNEDHCFEPGMVENPLVVKVRELATSTTGLHADPIPTAKVYAIPEEHLPSCTMIATWAAAMAESNDHAFAGGLRGSVLKLGRKYMGSDKYLPLVS